MSLNEEYNALKFAKDLLKVDEFFHKLYGTETDERSCQRKALETIVELRKSEIEQIYNKLLLEMQRKQQAEENNDRK